MEVSVQLPDEIASRLGDTSEMPRHLLESLAAEAYRTGKLSRHEISHLLGLDYWQTENFLNSHEAKRPYSLEDLAIDRQSLGGLDKK